MKNRREREEGVGETTVKNWEKSKLKQVRYTGQQGRVSEQGMEGWRTNNRTMKK